MRGDAFPAVYLSTATNDCIREMLPRIVMWPLDICFNPDLFFVGAMHCKALQQVAGCIIREISPI